MRPVVLPANQPARFYRGGASIAALRGADNAPEWGPEDWVASTTTLFGEPEAGLSRLPGGELLRTAIAEAPQDWLGPDHVAAFGPDPALLVKLLDAGQRLPVHCHPDDEFAKAHLGCRYGKTEAWIVIGTSGPEPLVYLGFREDVTESAVADWVSAQDSDALLGALNPIPVAPGDTVFVPAGTPHAIGAGVFVVELQQPTDLSLLLEWTGFTTGTDDATGHLGIGYAAALACLDRSAWPQARLDSVTRHTAGHTEPVVELFAPGTATVFRADRLTPSGPLTCDQSFAILVILSGAGTLRTELGDELALRKGDTVVVPYAAGPTIIDGDIQLIRCRPPTTGGVS